MSLNIKYGNRSQFNSYKNDKFIARFSSSELEFLLWVRSG